MSKDTVNRHVISIKEDKYNNKAEAMFHFKKIFSKNHMSHYDDVDTKILDECRTTVPLGFLKKILMKKTYK